MENVFSKVAFNGSLSITGAGFKAVGASGTTLLNGISQGYLLMIIFDLNRPTSKKNYFLCWKSEILFIFSFASWSVA
jgi:hypothetical protein